jgi:hypothetical protein
MIDPFPQLKAGGLDKSHDTIQVLLGLSSKHAPVGFETDERLNLLSLGLLSENEGILRSSVGLNSLVQRFATLSSLFSTPLHNTRTSAW